MDEVLEESMITWLRARGWEITKGQADLSGFDAFWADYPRKLEKVKAKAAYDRAIKRGATPEAIHEGLLTHLAANGFSSDVKYIPHATTWLNGKRWEDVPSVSNFKKPQIGGPSKRASAVDEWLNG